MMAERGSKSVALGASVLRVAQFRAIAEQAAKALFG